MSKVIEEATKNNMLQSALDEIKEILANADFS